MKQAINEARDLREQPESVQELACTIFISIMQGKRFYCCMELGDKQKAWLREEGFQFSFNNDIMEWEILIKEE